MQENLPPPHKSLQIIRLCCWGLILTSCVEKTADTPPPHPPAKHLGINTHSSTQIRGSSEIVNPSAHDALASDPVHKTSPATWSDFVILETRKVTSPEMPDWLKARTSWDRTTTPHKLIATGLVQHVEDTNLGQTTAVNRARHALTKWLNQKILRSTRVTQTTHLQKMNAFAAQVEIELPNDWVPKPKALKEQPR